jgi:tetratricopeptide (TPR) repeat protein
MDSHSVKLDEANRLLDAGHFAKALELLSELIQEVSAKPSLKGLARLAKVRALIGLGNLDDALHLVEQMLDVCERKVYQNLRPYFLHERARIAHTLDDKQSAIAYYREELLYLSSSMSHYFARLAENYIAQGTIFLELGDRAECDIYLRLAHDYADRGTSDRAYAALLTLKGRCCLTDGEVSKALELFCEARDLYVMNGLIHESTYLEKIISELRQ